MKTVLMLAVATLALSGCERDVRNMYEQPRLGPDAGSPMFVDGKATRRRPPGTVAYAMGDLAKTSGGRRGRDELAAREAAESASASPAITQSLLERGRSRYDIACAPCHGVQGDGDGMIARRGFPTPPSLLDARARGFTDRHVVDVVTQGLGVMPSLADRLVPQDRWAVTAYVRALQAAQPVAAAASSVEPPVPSAAASAASLVMRRHAPDLVALLALLVALPGLALAPTTFFASWLTAWWFCLLTTMGLLASCCIHALTGGRWGLALQLVARPLARGVPWLCVLFLPLAAGLHRVFPWAAGGDWTRSLDLPAFQLAWFTPTFFWTRMAVYALLWCALARPAVFANRGRVAAAAFAWVISGTLATTDLVVSLLPGWYSTAHGLVNLAGGALGGAALATLVLARRVPHAFPTPRPRPAQPRAVPLWRDLGNLLLMWTMLWAYVAFVEFLIQWAENLPREVQWLVPRINGGWAGVGLALALLQFGACFIALLFRANKDDPRRLAWVAAALLGGQLLNCAWLVLPSVDASTALGWWLVPTLAVAMGLPVAARAWRGVPLDTVLAEPEPGPKAERPPRESDGAAAHA